VVRTQKQVNGYRLALLGMFWFAITFALAPANAQSASPQDLLQCDKIKAPEDRLACFNTIVEKLKEDPDAFKRSMHGGQRGRDGKQGSRSNNQSTDFGRELRPRNTPKKITSKVKRYWRDGIGKWYFHLENGQVWKETSGSHMRFTKKVEEVKIKKGLIGGYLIIIEGAPRTGRVKRID